MRDELGTEHGVHEAGVAEVVGHEAWEQDAKYKYLR